MTRPLPDGRARPAVPSTRRWLALSAGVLVALAGCGSDGPPSSTLPSSGTTATVPAATVAPAGSETTAPPADATGGSDSATVGEPPTVAVPAESAGSGSAASIGDATAATTAGTEPAWAEEFGRATVTMEGRPLRVVVASTDSQRSEGLRQVSSLAPFDGMLFVFDQAGRTSFTMADTLIPLSIGFYDDAGQPVGQLQMFPCAGTDATCPVYDVGAPFRYALETELDRLPTGSLQI